MDRVSKMIRRQCLFAFISALVVVVCVCAGVTMNLTTVYDENFDHMGIRTFCMFTVNSNILTAAAMSMVIPYTLDGLRKHNYHMPRWIVTLVYAAVTAVTLTFLISLCVLAPFKGFRLIFSGSRFFLHGVCPILAFLAFCFFMSEQRLCRTDMLLAFIPVLLYAAVYYVMVVVIGENRGGWNDFYGFATRVPIWASACLILVSTFCITVLVRFLHNWSYRRRREAAADYYRRTFAGADVREIVSAMGRARGSSVKMRDVVVPTRLFAILLENSGSDCSLEECCELFIREYLAASAPMDTKKLWI